jgi:hypothetical protein
MASNNARAGHQSAPDAQNGACPVSGGRPVFALILAERFRLGGQLRLEPSDPLTEIANLGHEGRNPFVAQLQ